MNIFVILVLLIIANTFLDMTVKKQEDERNKKNDNSKKNK
jgi:uncharacterized membrane protein YhaH (DUF805 family)